ncbi:hypothetical protein C8R43DRAFT_951866 [Mycena crocata]|nr:hypothetical protein C8R43DRAFT_951866 [Mycena crocata]
MILARGMVTVEGGGQQNWVAMNNGIFMVNPFRQLRNASGASDCHRSHILPDEFRLPLTGFHFHWISIYSFTPGTDPPARSPILAMLKTQEDALYIMRLARAEDASGTMRKFREELLAFKQRIAAEGREKQKEKEVEAAAEILRLQSIHIITDPDQLKALPVRKKNSASLRDQLDARRDLWKDEVLVKAKLKDISKKADMLAAILAADQRICNSLDYDASEIPENMCSAT